MAISSSNLNYLYNDTSDRYKRGNGIRENTENKEVADSNK